MNLDPNAVRNAEQALGDYLRAEAEQQQAYLFHFPDGHVSPELEWLDVRTVARTVIAAYLESLSGNQR